MSEWLITRGALGEQRAGRCMEVGLYGITGARYKILQLP